jgi:NAD(P)-dependent dehydrogenase (short-subunit alcohol dehydrogenase family)
LACAGIIEKGKWFDPELTIETVEKEETKLTLEVNLWGTCMFARIAVVYLKHAKKEGEDKSLTLISSAAGFRESPGLWMYQVRAAMSLPRIHSDFQLPVVGY